MRKLNLIISFLVAAWLSAQAQDLRLSPDMTDSNEVLAFFKVDNNWLGESFALTKDKSDKIRVLHSVNTSGIPGPAMKWLDVVVTKGRTDVVRYSFTLTHRKTELQFYILEEKGKYSLYLFDRRIGS